MYRKTVSVLKREELLSKINKNYNSNITLEDILKKVQFLPKLKIPFIIINLISAGIGFLVGLCIALDLPYEVHIFSILREMLTQCTSYRHVRSCNDHDVGWIWCWIFLVWHQDCKLDAK